MKTITLFLAFEKATKQREYMVEIRGNRQGIAIHKDEIALRWQRYDRLIYKLRYRLLGRMKYLESLKR